MKNGYSAYRSANVDTADQGKLILIAYDVAIKNCKLAIESFEDRKLIADRTAYLLKVQDAITELMSALRLDVGEIAKNLYRLYDYMLRRLIQANAKNDSSFVEEVSEHLSMLRSAWVDAIEQTRRMKSTQGSGVGAKNFAASV